MTDSKDLKTMMAEREEALRANEAPEAILPLSRGSDGRLRVDDLPIPAAARERVEAKRKAAAAVAAATPALVPGASTSEGKLSNFVVRIGAILMTLGTLVATIGPAVTKEVDLGVIGGALVTIGAVLAGKTAQHYTTERTALKQDAVLGTEMRKQ